MRRIRHLHMFHTAGVHFRTQNVRFSRIGHLSAHLRPLVVRFWRIGHKKCVSHTFSRSLSQKPPHNQHTSQSCNNTTDKTSCKIAERTGHMTLAQPLHHLKHDSRHRRQSAKKTQTNTATDRLSNPTTQPRCSRHIFGQHRKKKTRKHIRNECADNKRRAVHRRQQHIQSVAATNANKAADKHNQIHQSIRQRIEPCLNTLHRSEWNLRRIRRCSRSRRSNADTGNFRQVDRLRSRIRIVTRIWRESRLTFLRFHCAPLYWPLLLRTTSFRNTGRATTSWPQLPPS